MNTLTKLRTAEVSSLLGQLDGFGHLGLINNPSSQFLLLEQTPFQNGSDVKKRNQEVTKVVSLVKMAKTIWSVSSRFKRIPT